MNKKYELTDEFIEINAKKLYRIKALKSFNDVKAGDIGGYIEKYKNLSQDGNAWVYGDVKVYDNAYVYENACVYGNARIFGCARVHDNAEVGGYAEVHGNAEVSNIADYTTIKGFGTDYRNTTFFRCKDKEVRVSCGCFYGTIPEFREQVKNTRTGKVAEEYLIIADLMEKHFNN